jgi:hypothetical protein
MSEGVQGPQWAIGTQGDGLAGALLAPGMSPLRGAGVDREGFLVIAVTDKPAVDLIKQALDLAGCRGERLALTGTVVQLANGTGAAGDSVPANATRTLALTVRAFNGARRIFPEVTAVAPSVWQPVQSRQVRYVHDPAGTGTYSVRLHGQAPVTLHIRGYTPPADAGAGTPAPQ